MHSGCCIASIEHAGPNGTATLPNSISFFFIRLSAPALFGFFFSVVSFVGQERATERERASRPRSGTVQQKIRQICSGLGLHSTCGNATSLKKYAEKLNRPQVNLDLSLLDHDKQLDGYGAKSDRRGSETLRCCFCFLLGRRQDRV